MKRPTGVVHSNWSSTVWLAETLSLPRHPFPVQSGVRRRDKYPSRAVHVPVEGSGEERTP